MFLNFAHQVTPAHRTRILVGCAVFALAVAAGSRYSSLGLGVLYMAPLLVSAVFLPAWMVFGLAILATALREHATPNAWQGEAVARCVIGLISFSGPGLFVTELSRRRRIEAANTSKLRAQDNLRREAQDEARIFIESSPAAILTVNPDGAIGLMNEAARRLLGFGAKTPEGEKVGDYFPMLSDFLKSKKMAILVRTMVEGRGQRRNGDHFFTQMWVSTYNTAAGTKLAVVFSDASEQLRDREELGLRQLLMNSRIIAGAVSHEIRNLAAAAAVLHANIGESFVTAGSEDFRALGRLITGMRKLSSVDVPSNAEEALTGVDLQVLLEELKIIVHPAFRESEIELRWEVTHGLPRVRADHSGLLQVFLNLVQNSRRALDERKDGCVTIAAYQLGGSVVVHFSDNGPGIPANDGLFQPFQSGATSTGLGLYISRAIVRTYGGELQYIRKDGEGRFLIELPAMATFAAFADD